MKNDTKPTLPTCGLPHLSAGARWFAPKARTGWFLSFEPDACVDPEHSSLIWRKKEVE